MKRIFLFCALIAGLMLASCQSEPNNGSTQIGKDKMLLRFNVEQQSSQLATRAGIAPEPGEEVVNALYLLFFEPTSDGSGQFKGYLEVTSNLVMDTEMELTFPSSSGLDGGQDYNVLAVANIAEDKYLNNIYGGVSAWFDQFYGKTESQVKNMALAYVTGKNEGNDGVLSYDDNNILPSELLMSGSTKKNGNNPLLSVTLKRGVSRFDVINDLKETTHDVVTVSIWNAYPTTPIWDGVQNMYNEDRFQRAYGITSDLVIVGALPGTGDYYDDIVGGLYALENYVVKPEAEDDKTTCLIIGVQPRDDVGNITYYRVNIHPDGSAQTLKRNNVYKLTIRGVNGEGATTELEAFKKNENKLSYVINYWDLDSDGMIQYDGDNILGIPSKTVKLKAEGEVRELSIFTFGDGTLTLSNKLLPAGIEAELIGKMLRITASNLGGEDKREGLVELSFAGLKATINIIQSGETDKFLELSKYNLPSFAPFANYGHIEGIQVNASGSWKAQLYPPGGQFSFQSGQLKESITSSDVVANTFQLYTAAANTTDPPELIYGFVTVTLDADYTINRAVVLTQRAPSVVSINPGVDETEGIKYGATGTLKAGYNNAFSSITVGRDPNDLKLYPWHYSITGTDAAYFEAVGVVKDEDVVENNTLTIVAKGNNPKATKLKAVLTIYMVSDPTNTKLEIPLEQDAFDFKITPLSSLGLSSRGAKSATFTPSIGDPTLTWKATIERTDAYALTYNEEPYLIYDNGGNWEVMDLNQAYPVNTKFRMVLPKRYYPDLDATPTYKVKLQIQEADVPVTVEISQAAISPRAFKLKNLRAGWGSITSTTAASAFQQWPRYLFNTGIFGPSGLYKVNPAPAFVTNNIDAAAVPDGVTYVQAGRIDEATTTQWNNIAAWRAKHDGNFVMFNHDNGSNTIGSLLTGLGYARASGSGSGATNNRIDSRANGTKIWEWMTKDGPFSVASGNDYSLVRWYNDGYFNAFGTWPANAVPIIQTLAGQPTMIVDPVNNIVVLGESQFFETNHEATNPTGSSWNTEGVTSATFSGYEARRNPKSRFTANLQAYIIQASRLGSQFTETMIGNTGEDHRKPWKDAEAAQ